MKIKINKQKLLLYISLIIMIEPMLFYQFRLVNIVYKILQYIVMIITNIYFIKKKKYDNPLFFSILLFYGINCVITLLFNYMYVIYYQYDFLYAITLCEIGIIFLSFNYKRTINQISIIFAVYIIINYISLLLYPNGIVMQQNIHGFLNNYYFLGQDNQFMYFIIAGLTFIGLDYYINKKELKIIIVYIVTLLTVFFTQSATSILVVLSFFVLYILNRLSSKNFFVKIDMKKLIIGYIFIYFFIVIFQNIDNNITKSITNMLGKDLTFSGRTSIWKTVFFEISKSPFIGFGATNERYIGSLQVSSHNIFLQIVYESGLVGLICFFGIFYVLFIKLNSYKFNKFLGIAYIGIFCIFLSMLTEVYDLGLLFLLIIIVYSYNKEKI